MRRAAKERFLCWDGHVYERIGTLDEVDSLAEARKGSGYAAKVAMSHGGRIYKPGDVLPRGHRFPRHTDKGALNIPVHFSQKTDFERLVEKGQAKRKRGRPPL